MATNVELASITQDPNDALLVREGLTIQGGVLTQAGVNFIAQMLLKDNKKDVVKSVKEVVEARPKYDRDGNVL